MKIYTTRYFLTYAGRKYYILVGKQILISTCQLTFPGSKSTIETLEKGVKCVQC